MRSRVMNLLRALGALGVLGLLVAGVPALLVATVGNPLPSEIPSIDELRVVLTQNGDGFGRLLIGALAVLIWFLWAQVMLAFAAETLAVLRRRPARSLPTLPGIQPAIRQLVAAITLSISLAGAPVLAPALGALHLDAVEQENPIAPSAAADVEDGDRGAGRWLDASRTVPDVPAPAFVLHERTELWDLAEAAYGDGLAWTEIAAANAGLVDADGASLTTSTEAVAAGTSIRLPGSVAASAVAGFGTHIVQPGESLWSIAADETQRRTGTSDPDAVGPYWHEVVTANADLPSGDIDVVHPGDQVVLPGSVPDLDGPNLDGPNLDEPPDLEPSDAEPPDAEPPDLAGVIDGPPIEAPRPAASTMTSAEPDSAAESTGSFEIRRRGISASPTPEPVQVSGSASTSIDVDHDDEIPASPSVLATAGGALLAAGLIAALRRRRALQWRQRTPGRVPPLPSTEAAAFEAILSEAASHVEVSQLGNGWVGVPGDAVDRVVDAAGIIEIDLRDREVGACGSPATVTAVLGTDEVTNSPLLIGLAPSSATALDGTAGEIASVVQLLALDLAVSERFDDVRVIAVDVGGELGDLERVECVASWSDACVVAHRLGSVTETGGAIVVLGASPADDDRLALLSSLGAAAVGPFDDAVDRIRIQGDRAIIEPAGIEVMLAALPEREFGFVAELVTTTTLAVDALDEPPTPDGDLPDASGCPLAAGPVEVRVLGPVEVAGAAPFSSVKAVDVVTYLAFHRQGVDADQLKTWVWPSFKPPTDKAFANVMSRARTGLGADDEGVPYLSRAGSDRLYRLAPAVTTDFDRLRGLVDLANDAGDQQQRLVLLQQALELVRGIPFTGGTASSFAWADNQVRSHVEFTIDEAVHACADVALELGNYATARSVVRTGLQVVPGCEQCFRRRFLIASADNNRQELRSAMADLERTAAAELGEPEGVDFISRDLLMLFEALDRDLIAGAP